MNCPHCDSEKVIKAGKIRNKYVTKQGHRCKGCGRYFIERDGFEGMTYPKEIIVAVLYLFVEGLSLGSIREFIYQEYGYWIYDGSILNWVRKYANKVEDFEHDRMPKLRIKGRNLFEEQLPLSKIRDFMYRQYGYRIKNGSILNWVRKYEISIMELERDSKSRTHSGLENTLPRRDSRN